MTKAQVVELAQRSVGADFARWLEFELDWEAVLNAQGQLVPENVPGDSGGLTFAGVDRQSHPHFPFGDPRPLDVINAYLQAWRDAHGAQLPAPVGAVLANYAVNAGAGTAVKLLQESLNALGAQPPLKIDGVFGPLTQAAAARWPDAPGLAQGIIERGDAFYRGLGRGRLAKFLHGWLNRDQALRAWCQASQPQAAGGAVAS